MSLLFRNAISIALFSVSATGPPCCPAVWARNVPPNSNAPIPSAHAAPLRPAVIFSMFHSFAQTALPYLELVGAGLAPPPGHKLPARSATHNSNSPHSYRNDSIGCNLAAWFAGKYPKNNPVEHDTTNASTTLNGDTGTRKFPGRNNCATAGTSSPIKIPSTAPPPLIKIASV